MAQVRARRINGNLLYYEGHRERIIGCEGWGANCYKLTPDKLNLTTVDPVGWTTTVVEAGAGTTEFIADTAGKMVITCAANENDGGNYQLDSLYIAALSTTGFCMTLKAQINDVDQTDLFFGAAATDTTALGGVADGVYMESLDGSATVAIVAEKDSSETTGATTATIADATDFDLDIFWDGTTLRGYVDGVRIYNAVPAEIPDDVALRPTIAFLTGEAIANTLTITRAVWSQWLV